MLDAVHRFALRLARDPAAAEDLAQETYLRAYRAWEGFAPGTNCRAWLFTICRHTHDFFEQIVDDALLQAIDALPEDNRETPILSDLGT